MRCRLQAAGTHWNRRTTEERGHPPGTEMRARGSPCERPVRGIPCRPSCCPPAVAPHPGHPGPSIGPADAPTAGKLRLGPAQRLRGRRAYTTVPSGATGEGGDNAMKKRMLAILVAGRLALSAVATASADAPPGPPPPCQGQANPGCSGPGGSESGRQDGTERRGRLPTSGCGCCPHPWPRGGFVAPDPGLQVTRIVHQVALCHGRQPRPRPGRAAGTGIIGCAALARESLSRTSEVAPW
jgi:hypothetical protein